MRFYACVFVLRTGKTTAFVSNVVGFFVRNPDMFKIGKLSEPIFSVVQNILPPKLCNLFSNFNMLYLAVKNDFVHIEELWELSINMQLNISVVISS